MALLDKPDAMWRIQSCPFDNWNNRVGRTKPVNALAKSEGHLQTIAPMILNNFRRDRVSMSILGVNKKLTTGKKHIRTTIMNKIKTAVNLIVVRGADTTEVKGRPVLVFNQREGEHNQTRWILQGWSYIFFPTLHIYRMSYHDLIPKLRSALCFIYERGSAMETRWAAQITLPDIRHTLPPLRRVNGLEGVEVTGCRPPTVSKRSRTKGKDRSDHTSTDRAPGKVPLLLDQEDLSRTWKLVLDDEADRNDKDLQAFDIDIQEDSPLSHANSEPDEVFGEPRLLPFAQQPEPKDTQWPSTPASPSQTTTDTEDIWPRKYPTSVRDKAKRRLFRHQAVIRPPPEPKRSAGNDAS